MSEKGSDAAAESAKTGTKQAINAAAALAKHAAKNTALKTAGAASGPATMGVGTAIAFALAHKDTIIKAIITVSFFFFIIIASIASLPNMIFGTGQWSKKDVTDKTATLNNTNNIVNSVKSIIYDRHSTIKGQINDDISSNGYLSPSEAAKQEAANKAAEQAASEKVAKDKAALAKIENKLANDKKAAQKANSKAEKDNAAKQVSKDEDAVNKATEQKSKDEDAEQDAKNKSNNVTSYTIDDNYSDVENNTIYLAMSAYCIAVRDGKADNIDYSANSDDDDGYDDISTKGMTNLEKFIAAHEGFVATAYRGVDAQNLTIGYGHVIIPGDGLNENSTITKEEALRLMRKELEQDYESVAREFGTGLYVYQRDALADFAFNEGTAWNKWPSLVSTIRNKNSTSDDIKNALLKFTTSDGVSCLSKIRIAEWQMYCKGIYAFSWDTDTPTPIATVPIGTMADTTSKPSTSSKPSTTSSKVTSSSNASTDYDTNEATDPDTFKQIIQERANVFMIYTKVKEGNKEVYKTRCDTTAIFDIFNLDNEEEAEAIQMAQNLESYVYDNSDIQQSGTNGTGSTSTQSASNDVFCREAKSYQNKHSSMKYDIEANTFCDPFPGHESYKNITCPFGPRINPVTKKPGFHTGIDISYSNIYGIPISAIAAGKVIMIKKNDSDYGNCVLIYHGSGWASFYAHMSSISVKVGSTIRARYDGSYDSVGKVGSTGNSTGPHLHLSIIKDGTYVDPQPFMPK